MNIQNNLKRVERELKIRNYSSKIIKSYLYGLKEYFAFKDAPTVGLRRRCKIK